MPVLTFENESLKCNFIWADHLASNLWPWILNHIKSTYSAKWGIWGQLEHEAEEHVTCPLPPTSLAKPVNLTESQAGPTQTLLTTS